MFVWDSLSFKYHSTYATSTVSLSPEHGMFGAEKITCRYGKHLPKYWIIHHRGLTRGEPPAWGLGQVLTTLHHQKPTGLKTLLGSW